MDAAGAMGWVSVPCCSGSPVVVSGRLLVCPRRAVEGSCGWACRLPGKRCCCGTGKAVRCDGWCNALRWAMQRAAMAGAACCVFRASAQAGSALCGESKEGMPWSRAARVPFLSGKPGFPACRALLHCAVCHGLQSALRRLLGRKAPFRVPHCLIVRPICCAKAEIVIPL